MNKEIFRLLKPQNIFLNKKRVGPLEDGGYVMPEFVLDNCSALFTYGVGNDSRYEVEFAQTYKKPVYLFDHLIFAPIEGYEEHQKNKQIEMLRYWSENGCTFINNGLGFEPNCKDFYENYKELNINDHVFLKIDIEGGEYDYFLNTDINNFENTVMGMSLEVHWINSPQYNEKLYNILKKISKYFILCHVHGNNWGNTFEFEGYMIPETLELSFINKKFVEMHVPDDQEYPIAGLDVPNNPSKPDYSLDFLNIFSMPEIKNVEELVIDDRNNRMRIFNDVWVNNGFYSNSDETKSGGGSTLEMTENIRKEIVKIIKEKNIKTVVDIPCGDFNWMKEIVFRFERYVGGDIVPDCIKENNDRYSNSRIKFIEHDILQDPIPDGDLLIVRDLIGHYPLSDGKNIIDNILKSNCKYLLCTTWYNDTNQEFNNQYINNDIPQIGKWYPINLMAKPFNFPDPDFIIEENSEVLNYEAGDRKVLAFWEIEKIRNPQNFKTELSVTDVNENNIDFYVEKYGTDKKKSGYSYYYEKLFSTFRNKKINVLEIGIGTLLPGIPSTFCGNVGLYPHYTPGGSLRTWRDYFPNSQVYGVDIAEDCKFEEDRIKTFIFDSQDKDSCDDSLTNLSFDVIIDDGLHTAIAQIKTLQNLFDRVKINGYYIIEDCGGGGDGTHILNDNKKEFLDLIEDHEYVNLGNIIFIRKNNSGKGDLGSLDNFVQNVPKLRVGEIKSHIDVAPKPNIEVKTKELTVVTGLWDIGRMGRDFTHYIEHFKLFLQIPVNMFIYIPKEYEHLVWEVRSKENTYVRIAELDYIKNLYKPFWDKTQSIRTDPKWYNMTGENGWLVGSPQATLEYYNPIVQSKMFLLNDATIWNPFGSEYFIWLDAGITNTVYDKYFTENRVLDKIIPYLDDFLFLSYPYEAAGEIHGFDFSAMNKFAGQTVKYVCRGGLFGGKKEMISQASSTYYSTLITTLDQGYMGTEESIFAIMSYREPNLYRRYSLDGNGLIVKFIEALINDTVTLEEKPKNVKIRVVSDYELSKLKTNLYILTFNFPDQVQHTINTMEKVPEWLTKPHLVLIDNSTDQNAIIGNKLIAEKYNMEYIPMEQNTGICGGRQKAAEHFHESDSDFMFFFEDDMTVNPPEFENQFCRNGFRKYIPNLYNLVHKIILKEGYDFLKLSFTEVFFDNDRSLPWYNVPQSVRTRDWPDYSQLPIQGLDPNSPHANYKHIKTLDGLAYVEGDVNYANWPMIVSKEGNKKMFIDTKWAHPYEQTWSSHIYNLMKEGTVTAGLLLASPIWHDRILWYKPEERREN